MKLNSELKDFWRTRSQIKILYGGRMSSKTMDTAGVLAFMATKYKIRVACLRRFQNKLSESVYSTLKRTILDDERLKNEYRITETSIKSRIGSEFIFMGIQRNLEEIKGLDNISITWIEESEQITQEQWDLIRPTVLREDNSFCLLIFNPRLVTDYVWKEFVVKSHDNVLVKKINYTENPFLSNSAKQLILADEAILDKEDFEHIYLGEPKANDEESIIKRVWIMAAIDAHTKLNIEPSGIKVIGFDVADDGGDSNSTVSRYGLLTTEITEWNAKEHELNKSAIRVYNQAKAINAEIIYDSIGVGAGVGSKIKELNDNGIDDIKFHKYNAADAIRFPEKFYMPKVKNKDFFANLKAQSWWTIADRFKATYNAVENNELIDPDEIIAIDSGVDNLEKLITELSIPRKDYDNNGRVKVESKKDLKKRGIASPNCFVAGTLVLTSKGNKRIEDLKTGDYIITPMGKSKIIYTHASIAENVITNRGLTGTADHKIFTWNKGWVSLQMLSLCDIIEVSKIGAIKWQIMNVLFTKAKCSQFSTQVDTIVQEDMEGRTLEMSDFYIGGYGLKIMAKFLMGVTYIIKTMIGGIMKLKTLNVLIQKSIKGFTWQNDIKIINTEKIMQDSYKKPQRKQKSGIAQKKEGSGIVNMQDNNLQRENTKNIFVKFAKKLFCQEKHISQTHVQKNAQQYEQTQMQQKNVLQIVESAEKSSRIQRLQEETKIKDAQENAQSPSKEVVYNITLEHHNAYYANGILVKNCADAFIMSYADVRKVKRKELPNEYLGSIALPKW